MNMSGESCQNCMAYRRGECIGKGLCEYYKPAPSFDEDMQKKWPKTMRHHSSYAGSRGSDYNYTKEPKLKPKRRPLKDNPLADINYEQKVLGDETTVNIILRKFHECLLIWVSCDKEKTSSHRKYRGRCLLQYKDHCKKMESFPEVRRERAMAQALHMSVSHITKPCKVCIIADYILLGDMEYSDKSDLDLLKGIASVLRKKNCDVTEVVMKGCTDIIHRQVINPELRGEDE